ncbi:phosphatidylinositol 3-kinase catalytic subunit type 3-like [Vespa mandarinia]|uniref:phosphatidylinositol 3-kinase catalytic subunit type 3-like n=1 Tax=Vespa mandarinia TaxID=7446 RepID=UPI0016201093|nr:phosphatidylinositol 3-kinase catalytic subunit type 3-like [Vespa mandarinia]XP_046826941.1 phosphatidylinositol 3-kinase catalytic subunit type 3 [Vespa crabro]XP_047354109.1 phosphatidylinositol 3-kinase catalytic subunit type 3 [Vespa velutina]
MMEDISDKFFYVYSSSLDTKIQIKIGTLEGKRQRPEYDKLLLDPMLKYSGLYGASGGRGDLAASLQVWAGGRPLALPVHTAYKHFTSRWNWNQWVTLPISFSDLPRDAHLCISLYDCAGPGRQIPVGGTTISLFGKHGVFRQGMLDLRVWPGVEADGSVSTNTPGKARDHGKEQMQRLAKLAKKHRNGQMNKIDWLDRLTFREIELINEREKRASEYLYLMVEFPEVRMDGIPYSIVYYEKDGDEVVQHRSQPDVVTLPDYEILQENLVEAKHHKLARSLRSGGNTRELKPTSSVRDALNTILGYPPTTTLTTEEQDLIWKYRFYLSNQKKALTKFVKCVNWKVSGEERQALEMLALWAPPDPEDALELLGPAFTHPAVRRYAISRLSQAPDDDLMLYLLQLVQALKYEDFESIKFAFHTLMNEKENERFEKDIKTGDSTSTPITTSIESDAGLSTTSRDTVMDLTSFLITRACQNSTLANYFYWYLSIECEDQSDPVITAKQDTRVREMYIAVMKMFSTMLANGNTVWQKRRAFLLRQKMFIDQLVSLVKAVARESGNRKKKADRLRALLADPDPAFKINFSNFEQIPFPLDPEICIKGIIPEKASLFKSALMPSKLTFLTTENTEYIAIFKHGDDLRQDQLILQTIALMDKLLRRENLDLKLTPYRVLATSTRHGFLQFIESTTVAEVLASEGSILSFFRKHHPSDTGPYGVVPEVMDTYVRSCAGYCIITYVLGVGDRHLDNLLLTTSGKLFHIDFGYILGRDPKPLPPPMKLSKEMVEAMGGVGSEHYHEFRKQCYTAFLHLRRHANLILNLFSLMVDASVPDIALEPDKAVKKVQDKLRLDLSDEEAVHYVQNLLDLSVTAVMAALVEQLHKFAQYWRK